MSECGRRTRTAPALRGLVFATLAAGACALALLPGGCDRDDDGALLCYVGGTMRPAMEKLVERYRQQTGQEVRLDFGDSGGLLIRIENEQRGDLYVCHDPFPTMLENKKLGESRVVAALTPVIVVPKGNPKNIRGLPDLGNEGVRLIVTDFERSTLGHILPVMFPKTGREQAIRKNIVTTVRSGGQAANAVMAGTLDAAIVWNAVAFLRREKLDAIPIAQEHCPRPVVDAVTSATNKLWDVSRINVGIAVLNCSRRRQAAAKFAEFVASERNREVFNGLGFTPPEPK